MGAGCPHSDRRQERNAQLMDFKCVEFVEELMYGQWRKKPLGP